jgi:hypothetical protein
MLICVTGIPSTTVISLTAAEDDFHWCQNVRLVDILETDHSSLSSSLGLVPLISVGAA